MDHIKEPLKFTRETKRFLIYEGGASVLHLYIAKPALPRPVPRYLTVVIADGDDVHVDAAGAAGRDGGTR